MSSPLLSVQNLVSGYGSGDILQGVTLEIWPGEMVATIGRNGVGKSTLMKAIIGLLSLRRGSIYLRGLPSALAMFLKGGRSFRNFRSKKI